MTHPLEAWGPPEPAHPPRVAGAPAGAWHDGFYLLNAEALASLDACLDAWSFLLQGVRGASVAGRNAYGALIVQHADGAGILDPTTVRWWSPPGQALDDLYRSWLVPQRLPYFCDRGPWVRWRKLGGRRLHPEEGLAMTRPLGLGGKMLLTNFKLEHLVAYYATAAPVYRRALGHEGA